LVRRSGSPSICNYRCGGTCRRSRSGIGFARPRIVVISLIYRGDFPRFTVSGGSDVKLAFTDGRLLVNSGSSGGCPSGAYGCGRDPCDRGPRCS
jgi:hypothetical protein